MTVHLEQGERIGGSIGCGRVPGIGGFLVKTDWIGFLVPAFCGRFGAAACAAAGGGGATGRVEAAFTLRLFCSAGTRYRSRRPPVVAENTTLPTGFGSGVRA